MPRTYGQGQISVFSDLLVRSERNETDNILGTVARCAEPVGIVAVELRQARDETKDAGAEDIHAGVGSGPSRPRGNVLPTTRPA